MTLHIQHDKMLIRRLAREKVGSFDSVPGDAEVTKALGGGFYVKAWIWVGEDEGNE